MNIRPFQAIYPKLDLIASPESFFGTVKYQYREYFNSGFFNQDEQDSYFIYNIETPTRTHRGLIATISIADYDSGGIIKHEKTLAAKEQKTIHLILQREAMVKPALLTYRPHDGINELLEKFSQEKEFYSIEFKQDGHKHSFTQISDKEQIGAINDIFKNDVTKAYIADGHHRFSASSILMKGESKFQLSHILVAMFPFNELEILDHNRTVQILNEISSANVMAKLSKLFEIEALKKGRKPVSKHEITLLINKEWYSLTWKKQVLEKFEDVSILLDADLLNELVLHDLFSIKDVSSDIRIGYVTGRNGVNEMEMHINKNEYRIGFLLFPVSIDEMIQISDENLTLPPKSTWFEPRIINGLISQGF